MQLRNLIRLSGWALLLAVPLYLADAFIHPFDAVAGAMFDPRWTPIHIVEGILYLCITLGLVGFYVYQAERIGWLGLLGFVPALLGAAFIVNEGWLYHAHLLPYMAAQHPQVLSPSEWYSPTGPLGPVVAYTSRLHLAAGVGQLLLAIATIRAGVLPRVPAILLGFGQTLFMIYLITPDWVDALLMPTLIVAVLGVAVSYAWLGMALVQATATRASIPIAAPAQG
jgi:hypothetical protein